MVAGRNRPATRGCEQRTDVSRRPKHDRIYVHNIRVGGVFYTKTFTAVVTDSRHETVNFLGAAVGFTSRVCVWDIADPRPLVERHPTARKTNVGKGTDDNKVLLGLAHAAPSGPVEGRRRGSTPRLRRRSVQERRLYSRMSPGRRFFPSSFLFVTQ